MTVRASELATFAFCERAWYYARTGKPYENRAAMERGLEWHSRIERRSRYSSILIRSGILLFFFGVAIAVVQILMR